jgi:hypothetical protein
MRCSNCGAPRGRTDAFCPRCGWHYESGDERPVIIPPRALVPYHLDRAVLIGGATTAGLSAAWLAARWLLPRLLSRLGRAASPNPQPPALVAPPSGTQVEMHVWMRRVIIHRK